MNSFYDKIYGTTLTIINLPLFESTDKFIVIIFNQVGPPF